MIRDSLDEVIGFLDRSFVLFKAWGLSSVAERSRFAHHRRILIEAVRSFKDVQGTEWQRAERQFINEKRLTGYAAALTESHELNDVLPYLEACESELLRLKLKDMLSGPQHSDDETPESGHARNTLFELSVAARLWRSGLRPELSVRTDVRCSVGGKTLLIECKRPFSNAGIARAIRGASSQVRAALKDEHPGTRGVLAISLTRPIAGGHKYFRAATEAIARGALGSMVRDTVADYPKALRLPNSLVAVLFHAIAMLQVDEVDAYVTGQTTAMLPLAPEGSLDRRIADLLYERLKYAAY